MLALKASTVEACVICGGKLFYAKIVLGETLHLNASYVELIWLTRGVYV